MVKIRPELVFLQYAGRLTAIVVSLATANVYADETFPSVPAGAVTISLSRIALESEDVTIGPELIEVRDTLKNPTEQDVAFDVVFAPPDFDRGLRRTFMGPYFGDLKAEVNGKAVSIERHLNFYIGDLDVTDKVIQAGLTEFSERLDIGSVIPDSAIQSGRVAPELIAEDNEATWYTRRVELRWHLTIPAHKTVTMHYKFKPYIGVGWDIESRPKDCGTEASPKQKFYPVWLSYLLPTWADTIGKLTVRVPHLKGAQVAPCSGNFLKKDDGKTMTLSSENVHPQRVFEVVYYVEHARNDLINRWLDHSKHN